MAKMIPPIIPEETKSPGEKRVFELLKNDPKTKDWLVLHSLDTAKHVKQIFGEIDFVIVVPTKGVLVLEVKAVKTLDRRDGIWQYGRSSDVRGPFKQAAAAMHSLKNYVWSNAPELSSLLFYSAVCFPFIEFSEPSIEWHSWQVIDANAMRRQSFSESVLGVLQNARKHLKESKTARWFDPKKREPSIRQTAKLANLLRPEFELYESPRARKERLSSELKKYTAEQFVALDAMENNDRVIFSGPAGTGKTLLAIETTRRLAAAGKKILFVCYNKQLAAMLQAEFAALSGVEISTLHHYLMTLAGLTEPQNVKGFWQKGLPELALDSIFEAPNPPSFDILVIDEAQDILKQQYLDILDLSLINGFKDGSWRIFGDFEKQNIYNSQEQLSLEDFIKNIAPNVVRYSLTTNCRNTPQIAKLAVNLVGLEPGYKRILRPDNGIPVSAHYYKTAEQQQGFLLKALQNLLNEGFSESEIVVLSTKANAKSCAGRIKSAEWRERLAEYQQNEKSKIRYSSIHAFKGLESPVVVMTDVENLHSAQLFYIGASRAFHRLLILAAAPTQKEIDKAILNEKRILATAGY